MFAFNIPRQECSTNIVTCEDKSGEKHQLSESRSANARGVSRFRFKVRGLILSTAPCDRRENHRSVYKNIRQREMSLMALSNSRSEIDNGV